MGHAALPQFLPKLELWYETHSIVPLSLGSITAAVGSVFTYQLGMALTLTLASEVVDRFGHYTLVFTGEYGTNSIAGLTVYVPKATFTVASMDDS
jgi:hypothetical protein